MTCPVCNQPCIGYRMIVDAGYEFFMHRDNESSDAARRIVNGCEREASTRKIKVWPLAVVETMRLEAAKH